MRKVVGYRERYDAQVGHDRGEVRDVRDAATLDLVLAEGRDRDRCLLEILLAALRRDDHFLERGFRQGCLGNE
jgi:hypothetical protein